MKSRKIVSGALYDFCGYITTLKNPILVGGTEDPSDLLDALIKWSKGRGLDVNDPDIYGWNTKV
jgi:hypothetical protein